jgi:sodium/proline symporter
MTRDVYQRVLRRDAGEKELVFVSRLITTVLGAGALALAFLTDPTDPRSAVYYLVLYGWGGLAGCFSAPVLLAIYYRGMTRAGCLAGIVAGLVTTFVWHNVPALAGVAYEVIPAILISALTIFAVSSRHRNAHAG